MVRLSSALVAVVAVAMLAGTARAATDIQVQGLFPGRAVLAINGETRMLRVGDTSPEGVALLASSSKAAEVEVDGQRRVLTLTRQIASTFSAAERAEVRIPRSADSHYWVRGAINGQEVEMMVDTGATTMAMSSREAVRLGIDYRAGQRSRSQTAGGMVDTFVVLLDRVSLGAIEARQVRASVLEGEHPRQILLGNSLLGQLEMREESGVLLLRQKF